jgi:ADP-ribosylglycohydrolase
MQGLDTDSFTATTGALLGALLGPDAFDQTRWVAPFGDKLHSNLGGLNECSLARVADRMAAMAHLTQDDNS